MTKIKDMEVEEGSIKSAYELEREKPMPSKNHSIIQGNLYFHLRLKYDQQYTSVPEISILVGGKEKVKQKQEEKR